MPGQMPGVVVCQETLAPLRAVPGGLWSDAAQRLYRVDDGLLYMGFPRRDAAMIAATMKEEREWQGTAATLGRDAEFLRWSAPLAVEFINLIGRHVARPEPRALELGSGSGWVSWLLAEAGYDVFLCDFEANSLTLGLQFQHQHMGAGHRIVADARYAPFPSGVFDVVVFKEFVHHVAAPEALFREASRVLRVGGLVALMEPTMNLVKKVSQLRHPDPHEGHHITWPDRYMHTLRRLGLTPVHLTALYGAGEHRHPLRRALHRRAARQTAGGRPLTLFAHAQLRLMGGGQFVVLARKTREQAPIDRPPMALIEPSTVTVDEQSSDAYGRRLRPILEEAAHGLRAVAPA